MLKCTFQWLFLIHSPKGINFTISADQAIQNIHKKYGKRFFGADLTNLSLAAPSKEFVPFYLAKGTVQSRFTGTVTYTSERSSNGKEGSSTQSNTVYTSPQMLETLFHENRTQVYGGFKYHIGHMHSVLQSEAIPLLMTKMSSVNTREATINLFEQSTFGVRSTIEASVKQQVYQLAKERVQSFHPTASSIDIHFDFLRIKIEELTPVFLPCYVIKATYDSVRYTIYVSGRTGVVGGPYLLNALRIARTASITVGGLIFLFSPSKVAALLYAPLTATVVYLLAFYGSRYLPLYRRNRNRAQREALRQKYEEMTSTESQTNFRPTPESQRQRVREEYHSSSYWDTHDYQKRHDGDDGGSPSSALPRDPKGYYRLLHLQGDESVNEIRSAYRKIVLSQHPDIGGSNERMADVNAAYRVLRDPQRRKEYDASAVY